MNYLKIDINKIPDPGIKEIISQLNEALKGFGVEFYLIGARDLWLTAKGMRSLRFTRDIDLAILMNSIDQYDELLDYLIKSKKFIKCKFQVQRIYTSDRKYTIDLLPFGKIEKKHIVTFKDKEKTRLSTMGLKEVFEKTIIAHFDKNLEILTASLAGIVILKLIAWDEKPEARNKDIKDFAFILKHYFDLQEEMIYEKYNTLFDGSREIDQIAALALGKEMREILKKSTILQNSVTRIFENHIELNESSSLVQVMATESGIETDKISEYLMLILQGIKSKL